MKKILFAGLIAFFFWVYNPATGGLYYDGGFTLPSDCATVRAWVQANQSATAPLLLVSPACYPQAADL